MKMGSFKDPQSSPGDGGRADARLRVAVLDGGVGVWVYVRLGAAQRFLVECQRDGQRATPPFSFLRGLGELGPLTPLSKHLRPGQCCGDGKEWLWVLGLLRGLVLRRGGSWILWRHDEAPADSGQGFSFRARVTPRAGEDPPPLELRGELSNPPALVLGLAQDELEAMAGNPQAMVANSSPALKLAWPEAEGGQMLLGGDLRPSAWQSLLGDMGVCRLLGGVSCYAAGAPSSGFDLARGLKMAALPWLALGALQPQMDRGGLLRGRMGLATPAVGALLIDVDQTGGMRVTGLPWEDNGLVWNGLARPITDEGDPAPWPLRRALTEFAGSA